MNPQSDAGSPLATLRQLKEMLDAGAITPQEFETLKQRLVFGAPPTGETSPLAALRADEPALPEPSPSAELDLAPASAPPTEYLDTPAALTPEATPLLTPEPDWLAAPAPSLLTPDEPEDVEQDFEAPAERRNPLNLVFAIGGLLLFLGVMAYLALGRTDRADEHLTSTSQTAADSVAAAPEVGPQAEQLTLPPAAAPETIRVAPATPPPVAAAPVVDSAAVAPAPTPTPAKAPAATPTKAPTPKTPAVAPASPASAADSTTQP